MNDRNDNNDKKNPAQLPSEVAQLIDRRSLIAPGAAVVVGVSGGADSVALLSVLRTLAADPKRAYQLTVAHLDHGLRDESAEDARFVAELARSWELQCIMGSPADWPADESLRKRDGIEGEARRRRYAFLLDAARQVGAGYIAAGHHADDNTETIIERIVRGSHLRGVRGIAPARPIGDGGLMLVRPLLETRRSEIEAYCQRQNLTWRTDHTNADTAFRRNFIRHELLPLLRERMNPAVDDALRRLASAAGEVEDFLASAGEDALARAIVEFQQQPSRLALSAVAIAAEKDIIRSYAMRSALEKMGVGMRAITTERIEELAGLAEASAGSAVALPGNILARRERDEIIIESPTCEEVIAVEPVMLTCPGETTVGDLTVICTIEAFDEQAYRDHLANRPAGAELLDADKLSTSGPLICRPRCDGDSFVPLGSPGRQSVSDMLTNLKLPARARRQVRCICDSEGIIYLAPCRIADRVKITPKTSSILRIQLQT